MSNYRSRLNVDRVPRLFADWLQCSVTRSSAHLASVKCSFLHHCHSLLALSFVSNLHFTRLRLQDLPFHIVIIISQVLFFLLSFLAVCSLLCSQTGKVSFFRNPFFLATQSMCVVLSSPFLKKLGGRESRGLQTSWGFGWLLHIFLLLSSRFVSPVGVFLSNNFF